MRVPGMAAVSDVDSRREGLEPHPLTGHLARMAGWTVLKLDDLAVTSEGLGNT